MINILLILAFLFNQDYVLTIQAPEYVNDTDLYTMVVETPTYGNLSLDFSQNIEVVSYTWENGTCYNVKDKWTNYMRCKMNGTLTILFRHSGTVTTLFYQNQEIPLYSYIEIKRYELPYTYYLPLMEKVENE